MIEKSTNWLITINQPQEKGFTHEKIKEILFTHSIDYWCMCDEIGAKGDKPHTHLYIYKKTQIRFSAVKKWFPPAHIDYPNGTPKQCRDYIRKEGNYKGTEKENTNLKETFEEMGECPESKQGKRTDLDTLYQMIKDGMSDFEILEQEPKFMKRLDLIEKTRQILLNKEHKEKIRNVEVIYRYGKSGSGKTRSIYTEYGFADVFRITDYLHPFDGYRNEKVIVFEEFYSSNVKINDMLNYLDVYPLTLPSRYNNKQACYEKVYINSNIPLDKQYQSIQREHNETWKAFIRRINKIQVFGDTKKEFDSFEKWESDKNNEWMPLENLEGVPFCE